MDKWYRETINQDFIILSLTKSDMFVVNKAKYIDTRMTFKQIKCEQVVLIKECRSIDDNVWTGVWPHRGAALLSACRWQQLLSAAVGCSWILSSLCRFTSLSCLWMKETKGPPKASVSLHADGFLVIWLTENPPENLHHLRTIDVRSKSCLKAVDVAVWEGKTQIQ